MNEAVPLVITSLFYLILFRWGFRSLPCERWMILAAIPRRQLPDGSWEGVNLTYYGVFGGLAVVWGLTVAWFLMGTVQLPRLNVMLGLTLILLLCVPAAGWINRWVEGHAQGFTVGGAAFLGMLASPWLVLASLRLGQSGPAAIASTPAVLGALGVAYACGESIGRLGCLSFGCCYGRLYHRSPAWMRTLFQRWTVVFTGSMKKANLDTRDAGHPRLPIQSLTAIIYAVTGVAGMAMYLGGRFIGAYMVCVVVTQGWRFLSEFLRADTRRYRKISLYQIMALLGAAYSLILGVLWPRSEIPAISVVAGLQALTQQSIIALIAVAGVLVFLRMGTSRVTTSTLLFRRNDSIRVEGRDVGDPDRCAVDDGAA